MANEIAITASLSYSKNKATAKLSGTFSATQAGSKYEAGIQTVGTTEESINKGDVGTIGYLGVRNTDATNYVQFGVTTGVYSIKLLPGEFTVLPWKNTACLALANTASVDVEYLAVEA